MCFFGLVPLKGYLHFFTRIICSHEIWTHKKHNDISSFQMLLNFLLPLRSWKDLVIVPWDHLTRLDQSTQMSEKLALKSFVLVRSVKAG